MGWLEVRDHYLCYVVPILLYICVKDTFFETCQVAVDGFQKLLDRSFELYLFSGFY